jgi:hypothetical protein
MPTNFDLQFASGGMRSLLALHGEEVIYQPLHGAERVITALVTRRELMPLDPLEGAIAPQVQLESLDDHDDETYGGIDPELVDTGGDRIRLAWEQGGVLESRSVVKRIPSDGGVVRLEIR